MKDKYFINQENKKSVELEDVFLDSLSKRNDKIENSIDKKNIEITRKITFLILFILLLQAFHLQIIKGSYYSEISQKNYTRSIAIKSSRGIIYDKDGRQIVFNVPIFDLVITPNDFFKDKSKTNKKIEKLSQITKINKDDLKKKIEKVEQNSYQPLLILGNIDKEKALIIKEKIKKIDGVNLEKNAIRNYVDGIYFSHIIGYSGKIDERELENHPDYMLTDTIGKSGLEFSYERELRGTYGKQEIEVDSFGKRIRTIKRQDPQDGYDLVLNIDSELQKKIYKEIEKINKKTETKAGAAVALDPKTGAVLALVSLPSYDNNLFAGGISNDKYNKLLDNKSNPLFNRAISGEYPPGSTIKPLIGAAALQERIVSPYKTIVDKGVIYVGPYKFLDWRAHGIVDLTKAIAQSCNVYFYAIGGGYGDIKGLGIKKIKKYANLFGLGNLLGIDIPGEKAGLVPNKEWKKEVKSEKWYVGDTYHVSIGQGDILATPLQIAAYTAAIANGGKLLQPQIVDKIINSNGDLVKNVKPRVIRENFIDDENIKWIQKGMRENVVSGSGRLLYNLPVKAAGKTGTAQYAGNKKTHAWYTSYVPYDNPEIVLTVIIEGGGEGHQTAVPVVKEVFEWYFGDKSNL
jgi:penicillin-binding protein 2